MDTDISTDNKKRRRNAKTTPVAVGFNNGHKVDKDGKVLQRLCYICKRKFTYSEAYYMCPYCTRKVYF